MKKTYLLNGLDCAHCAAKIEKGVADIGGVTNASVSFLTTKLTFEAAEYEKTYNENSYRRSDICSRLIAA